jgi:hypothetical protein
MMRGRGLKDPAPATVACSTVPSDAVKLNAWETRADELLEAAIALPVDTNDRQQTAAAAASTTATLSEERFVIA